MVLPVVLGLISMANVDAASWVLNSSEVALMKDVQAKKQKLAAERGVRLLEPNKIQKSILRVLSVARIWLGAIAPGVRSLSPL